MLSAKVKKVYKDRIQVDNLDVVRVEIELLDEEEKVVDTKKFDYPFGTSDEEIEKELTKYVELVNNEAARKIANAEREKAEAEADKTIQKLSGKLIKLDLKEKVATKDK